MPSQSPSSSSSSRKEAQSARYAREGEILDGTKEEEIDESFHQAKEVGSCLGETDGRLLREDDRPR